MSCKKIILQFFLARFLQDFLYLARNASFLVQDLQDMCKIYCKILQVLQEKYLQDIASYIFLARPFLLGSAGGCIAVKIDF